MLDTSNLGTEKLYIVYKADWWGLVCKPLIRMHKYIYKKEIFLYYKFRCYGNRLEHYNLHYNWITRSFFDIIWHMDCFNWVWDHTGAFMADLLRPSQPCGRKLFKYMHGSREFSMGLTNYFIILCLWPGQVRLFNIISDTLFVWVAEVNYG